MKYIRTKDKDTGLEALKKIKWKLEDEGILGKEYELCDIIEKELKALNIIKDFISLEPHCIYGKSKRNLTPEEYELVKEVL